MTKYVMKNLSPKGVQKLLIEASKLIIKLKPDASYSASSTEGDMGYFARTAIEHYGLTREEHLNDFLNFRMVFEAAISKKYGVKFTYESNEYLADKYRKKRVPQNIQVQSGLLDCIIAELNIIRVDITPWFSRGAA
jgi:hypothetical protein